METEMRKTNTGRRDDSTAIGTAGSSERLWGSLCEAQLEAKALDKARARGLLTRCLPRVVPKPERLKAPCRF